MCRNKAKDEGAAADLTNTDNDKETAKTKKEEWLCHECFKFNADTNVHLCKMTKNCTGRTPKGSAKQAGATNSALSKTSIKLMLDKDPEKMKQENEEREARINELTESIEKYEAPRWKDTTPIETDHFRKERDRLEGLCREYRESANSVPVGSSLLGDQKRLNHNHLQKMKKLLDMQNPKKKMLQK